MTTTHVDVYNEEEEEEETSCDPLNDLRIKEQIEKER